MEVVGEEEQWWHSNRMPKTKKTENEGLGIGLVSRGMGGMNEEEWLRNLSRSGIRDCRLLIGSELKIRVCVPKKEGCTGCRRKRRRRKKKKGSRPAFWLCAAASLSESHRCNVRERERWKREK